MFLSSHPFYPCYYKMDVQVNPYKQLPNTGPEFVQMYQFSTASGGDAPPHIYKVLFTF